MKFKPEDFNDWDTGSGFMDEKCREFMAKTCNAKLKEWLDKAPILVGRRDRGLWACDEHPGFARATHKGKFVCIEEIK